MDKITNNTFNNLQKNVSKDRDSLGNISKNASIIKSESKINVVDLKDTKQIVSNLSKSAPIDVEKVAKIKEAISAGNYPLDLDKVSDALMQAYREMKS